MISGNSLKARGWAEGHLLGLAKRAGAARVAADADGDRERALDLLDDVRADQARYQGHAVLGDLAMALQAAQAPAVDLLREAPLPYDVWGAGGIDGSARAQMDLAARLPVSVAGALMPDAHSGYGLPIGGVLATVGAVIPYAVGSDIACRMRLSLYDLGPEALDDARGRHAGPRPHR